MTPRGVRDCLGEQWSAEDSSMRPSASPTDRAASRRCRLAARKTLAWAKPEPARGHSYLSAFTNLHSALIAVNGNCTAHDGCVQKQHALKSS